MTGLVLEILPGPYNSQSRQNSKAAPRFPVPGVPTPSPVIQPNTTLGDAMKGFCRYSQGLKSVHFRMGRLSGQVSWNHMGPLNLELKIKVKAGARGSLRFKACGGLACEKFFADGGDLEVRNAGGLQD